MTLFLPVLLAPPHTLVELTGFCAAFCTTVSFVPQLVRILKLRSAHEISLGMFSLFSLGVFLWLLYGIWIASKPVIASNGVTLVLSVSILILKLHYDRKHRKSGPAKSAPAKSEPARNLP